MNSTLYHFLRGFSKMCAISIAFLLVFSVCRAENYFRTNKEGLVNAKLYKAQLVEIKNILEDNFHIQFIGDEGLLQRELTMSFDGLSLEQAINRLLRRMNFVVAYNDDGAIKEIYIFSAEGLPLLPPSKFTPVLTNNFKQIYAEKAAALQTLNHFEEQTVDTKKVHMIIPEADRTVDTAAFKVEPNMPPGGAVVIDPGSLPADGTFEVVKNANPSGESFQIVPSAPPSRKE